MTFTTKRCEAPLELGHQAGDCISGHPPLHFDLSTFEIYSSLSTGAELHLVPGDVLLPQQLTAIIRDAELTQWSSDEMRQIFELIGGQMLHPSSMSWARVFRPDGRACVAAGGQARSETITCFRVPQPEGTSTEPLTPELLIEHMPVVTRSLRLFPAYDESYLKGLFAQLHRNRTWGEPVRRLVRDARGRVLGWYVNSPPGSRMSGRAYRVSGPSRGRRARCTLRRRSGAWRRWRSRNPEPLAVLAAGQAPLTRLEGDWWMAT